MIKVTRTMVVYYKNQGEFERDHEVHFPADEYLACSRATNRFVHLGRVEFDDEEYGPENALSDFQVDGNWLVLTETTGLASETACSKYDAEPCPTSVTQALLIFDPASGRRGEVPDIGALAGKTEEVLSQVLISSDGAVTWLQKPEQASTSSLYGCLARALRKGLMCTPRLLAQAAIERTSLRLAGKTVSWTAEGKHQSSVL